RLKKAELVKNQLTETVVLTVWGDADIENDENFFLNLTNVSSDYAVVTDGRATIRIVNDDGPLNAATAPTSYGTELGDDGARHFPTGPQLGDVRYVVTEGVAAAKTARSMAVAAAVAQNETAVSDGITFEGSWLDDDGETIHLHARRNDIVTAHVTLTEGAYLNGWLDVNGNGTFDESESVEFLTVNGTPVESSNPWLATGGNVVTFRVPAGMTLGKTYARFRVSTEGNLEATGLAQDGEVEDYPICISEHSTLEDGVLTFRGSDGGDELSIWAGDTTHIVQINDVVYKVAATSVTKVSFLGGTGSDQVNLVGTAGNDTFDAGPTWVNMTLGGGTLFEVSGVESLSLHGGVGGSDVATLTGTADNGANNATLRVRADSGVTQYKRAGSWNMTTEAISNVTVTALDARNTAVLYDSKNDDVITNTWNEGVGTIRLSGTTDTGAFAYSVVGFNVVQVGATAGGNDTAVLVGSDGADSFDASRLITSPKLSGTSSAQSYTYTFSGLDAISFTGTDSDRAILTDSAGDDTLTITPESTRFSGPTFDYTLNGVGTQRFTSARGGGDQVSITSSGATDRLMASADPEKNAFNTTFTTASQKTTIDGFRSLNVTGTGARSQAYLTLRQNGNVTAGPDGVTMTTADQDYRLAISGFDTVRAYSV
ncbi:MAG: GEVED domain-containing protein, partial [Planctomycetia bacterium]|nr:GEVED domain-containing protein [Planctomycetia bacterium]